MIWGRFDMAIPKGKSNIFILNGYKDTAIQFGELLLKMVEGGQVVLSA